MTEPLGIGLALGELGPGGDEDAFFERLGGVVDAIVVEIAVDEAVDDSGAGERPSRHGDPVPCVEREIEVEPDRDRTVGGRFTSERNADRIEAPDVSDPDPPAVILAIVGDGAFPIDGFG